MIKVGQKVTFDPWRGIHTSLGTHNDTYVEGTVVYVNPAHNYCTVEYPLGDGKFKTSFNFVDIFGEKNYVRLVRR